MLPRHLFQNKSCAHIPEVKRKPYFNPLVKSTCVNLNPLIKSLYTNNKLHIYHLRLHLKTRDAYTKGAY